MLGVVIFFGYITVRISSSSLYALTNAGDMRKEMNKIQISEGEKCWNHFEICYNPPIQACKAFRIKFVLIFLSFYSIVYLYRFIFIFCIGEHDYLGGELQYINVWKNHKIIWSWWMNFWWKQKLWMKEWIIKTLNVRISFTIFYNLQNCIFVVHVVYAYILLKIKVPTYQLSKN